VQVVNFKFFNLKKIVRAQINAKWGMIIGDKFVTLQPIKKIDKDNFIN